MDYLIDTHVFLWFINGSPSLSTKAKTVLLDTDNRLFISIVSLWEISIKTAIGKLTIGDHYETVIEDITENGIEILPINFAHTVQQNRLPFFHRDPFDRMIVSQAIVERISLISSDTVFDSYLSDSLIKRFF